MQTGVEFDGKGLIAEAAKKRDPSGPMPLYVGAVNWKGGKKGKEDKGKGNKGKYGKSKDGKNSKGNPGKSCNCYSTGSRKFQGSCSYCGKWGHKKSECRNRERDKKGKGGSANAVDKEEDKSTNAVQYDSLDNKEDWDPEEVWQSRRETGKWPRVQYQNPDHESGGASSSPRPAEVVSVSWRGLPKAETSGKKWVAKKRWAEIQEEEEAEAKDEAKEGEIEEGADYGGDGDEDKESWLSAITREVSSVDAARKNAAAAIHNQFIMYDSGSDEHVCKQDFGGYGEEQKWAKGK